MKNALGVRVIPTVITIYKFAARVTSTMLDLHIIAGIITAGFVRTSSDVSSLSVMSLKIRK